MVLQDAAEEGDPAPTGLSTTKAASTSGCDMNGSDCMVEAPSVKRRLFRSPVALLLMYLRTRARLGGWYRGQSHLFVW